MSMKEARKLFVLNEHFDFVSERMDGILDGSLKVSDLIDSEPLLCYEGLRFVMNGDVAECHSGGRVVFSFKITYTPGEDVNMISMMLVDGCDYGYEALESDIIRSVYDIGVLVSSRKGLRRSVALMYPIRFV